MSEREKDAYIVQLEEDIARQMLNNAQLRAYIYELHTKEVAKKSMKLKVL